jgi:hypothetical protein
MHPTVVKVGRMDECGRPKLCREGSSIEEGANSNSKRIIPFLSGSVLRRAVGTSGFDNVQMLLDHGSTKRGGSAEFPTLVTADDPPRSTTIHLKKVRDEVNRRFFRFTEEDPDKSRGFIHDE